MSEIHFGSRAFCKLILHCAKYPHCVVNGVLLAEKNKSFASTSVTYVDAVPLFHICRFLSPMLEIALAKVDAYCKSEGLCIAGYYQANENVTDLSPDFIAYKTADKIVENFSEATLVMVQNEFVCLSMDRVPLKVYHNSDGKWTPMDKSSFFLDDEQQNLLGASSLLQNKTYQDVIDFDNHFDDISQNWKNTELNDAIDDL